MSKALSFSLILVAFLLGIGFGFSFAPEYAGLKLQGSAMTEPTRDRFSDLRFLNSMATHHQGALELAVSAGQKTRRPELQAFTQTVQSLKKADITQFAVWKKLWYGDTRPFAAPDSLHLGDWDEDFDLRFLNALEPKLVDAIAMARQEFGVSTRKELLTYASELIRVQTGVLNQVRAWRTAWYGR